MNLPTPNCSMSLQLEGFKVGLDGAWSNRIDLKMSQLMIGGLDQMDLERSFQRFLPKNLPTPNHSMILQLEGFKVGLDGAWSNRIELKMSQLMIGGLDQMDLERCLPNQTIL